MREEKEITIFRDKISIPMTPNFLKRNGDYVSVGTLTPQALKKVAKEWTKNLLAKADKKFNQLNKVK